MEKVSKWYVVFGLGGILMIVGIFYLLSIKGDVYENPFPEKFVGEHPIPEEVFPIDVGDCQDKECKG